MGGVDLNYIRYMCAVFLLKIQILDASCKVGAFLSATILVSLW